MEIVKEGCHASQPVAYTASLAFVKEFGFDISSTIALQHFL